MLYSVVVVALCAAVASGITLQRHASVGSRTATNVDEAASSDLRRSSSGGRNLGEGSPLTYNFKQDYEALVNPNNENAEWRWAVSPSHPEAVSDSATFVRSNETSNTIDFLSIPFKGFAPIDSQRLTPVIIEYEALLVNKKKITVEPGQKLTVNVKFACKTVNNEDNPLAKTKNSVSNVEDDPSLAACGFGILSADTSALGVSMVATNKAVWVIYERNRFELLEHNDRDHREFTVFTKIAERQSPQEIIDGTIVYDRAQGKIHFKVNGKKVYTLEDLGTINQIIREQPAYAEVYTQNRPDFKKVEPQDIQVVLSLTQYPDTVDPSNPSNPPLRTSRMTTDPTYYDEKTKFEDDAGLKKNIIWGEGATMTLESAKIELSTNVAGRSGRLTEVGNQEESEVKQE